MMTYSKTNSLTKRILALVMCMAIIVLMAPIGSLMSASAENGDEHTFTFLIENGGSEATVKLSAATLPDTTATAVDGVAVFSAENGNPVAEGQTYDYEVSRSGYSAVTGSIEVGTDDSGEEPVTLNMIKPSITAQSTLAPSVTFGGSVDMTVTATGLDIIYQWYKGSVNSTNKITNETSDTLSITGAKMADSGVYICRVTNDGGYVDSNKFTLNVNRATPILTLTATTETTQTYGQSITLTATSSSVNGIFPTGFVTFYTEPNGGEVRLIGKGDFVNGIAQLKLNGGLTAADSPYTFQATSSSNDDNFQWASSPKVIYDINKADQTGFAFKAETPVTKTYGDAPFIIEAEGGQYADGGITYDITTGKDVVASIKGDMITILKAGTITVTATRAGNADYNDAVADTKNITVEPMKVEVTADDQIKEVDADVPVFTGSITNGAVIKDGDVFNITYQCLKDGLPVDADAPTGDYAIEPIMEPIVDYDPGKYDVTLVNGNLHVQIPAVEGTHYKIEGKTTVDNGWYTGTITVTAIGDIFNTVTIGDDPNFAASKEFVLDGEHALRITLKNSDTGEYTVLTKELKLDMTAPESLTVEYDESGRQIVILKNILDILTFKQYEFFSETVTVTLKATDDTSLIDRFEITSTPDDPAKSLALAGIPALITDGEDAFTTTDKTSSATFTIDPQYRGNISFVAYDKAGNSASSLDDDENLRNNCITVVDDIAPGVSVAYNPGLATAARYVDKRNGNDVAIIDEFTDIYYNGPISATIKVNEANFFEGLIDTKGTESTDDDTVIHNLMIVLTKTDSDGNVVTTEYLPKDAEELDAEADFVSEVAWAQNGDEYSFTINYSDNADYVLTVAYIDHSTNEAVGKTDYNADFVKAYTSNRITVDTVAPVIQPVTYTVDASRAGINGFDYYKQDTITAVLQIEDHNFRADEVAAGYTAVDVNGNPVAGVVFKDTAGETIDLSAYLADRDSWTDADEDNIKDNIWEARIVYTTDAQYTFTVNYSNLAGKTAQEVVSKVVLDYTKPVVEITYDDPSLLQMVVEAVTFRFYQPETTVKVHIKDDTSGAWNLDYEYKVDSGLASDAYVSTVENEGGEGSYAAFVDDGNGVLSATDKFVRAAGSNIQTAEFKIPAEFRGYVKVKDTTTDIATNSTGVVSALERDKAAVIVDRVAPDVSVTYTPGENTDYVRYVDGSGYDTTGIIAADTSVYYNGPISATIKVNEANFFEGKLGKTVDETGAEQPEAVIHNLKIVLTTTNSNGDVVKTEYLPEGATKLDFDPQTKTEELTWEQSKNAEGEFTDEYTVTIDYADDLDYVLSIEYVDHSTNDAVGKTDYGTAFEQAYTSNRITVDTVDPVIKPVEYTVSTTPEYNITSPDRAINGVDYYKQDTITAVLQIEDHNFRANEVAAGYAAVDVNGNPVADVVFQNTAGETIDLAAYLANRDSWTDADKDNIWEARIVYTTDAQYTFTINYSDLVNKAAQEVVSKVVLDDTAPVVEITYEEPSLLQMVVEAVTFRFYQPETTVKVHIKDDTSGVWNLDYEYKVDSGLASDAYVSTVENEGGEGSYAAFVDAGNGVWTATDKFVRAAGSNIQTAEFKIPAEFRGYVEVKDTTTDIATNNTKLNALADNKAAVIVDSVAPNVSVTYTPGENTNYVRYVDGSGYDTTGIIAADTSVYYNGPISATIKVNEANFFEGKVDTKGTESTADDTVIHNLKIVLTTRDSDGYVVRTEYLPKVGATQLDPTATADLVVFAWTQTEGTDEYSFTINYAQDLDYVLSIEYVDHSTNDAKGKTDYGADFVKAYTSNRITVDTVAPVIQPVTYTVDASRSDINEFDYYKQDTITAVLQIKEHNFRADEVAAGYEALYVNGDPVANVVIKDTDGNVIAQSTEELQIYLADHKNNWTNIGNNIWETRIVYTTDAQYTFTINYSDLANNVADEVVSKVVLDDTKPVVEITYEEPSLLQMVVEAVTFRFYQPETTVKVHIKDDTSGVWNLDYGYVVNSGLASDPYVSTVENEGGEGSYAAFVDAGNGVWTATDKFVRAAGSNIQTAEFKIPAEFRGYVEVKDTTTDIATNNTKLNALEDNNAAVIMDSVAPDVSVTYTPGENTDYVRYVDNQSGNDVAKIEDINTEIYYNGPISATIKVNEANFFEGKVDTKGTESTADDTVIHNLKIVLTTTNSNGTVAKTEFLPVGAAQFDNTALKHEFTWTHNEDEHSYTINYAQDYDYVLSIEYVDHSTNDAVGKTDYGVDFVKAYTSNRITVDTVAPVIQPVTYTIDASRPNTNGFDYYKQDTITAVLRIEEHNFRADEVAAGYIALDVKGASVNNIEIKNTAGVVIANNTVELNAYLATRANWVNIGNNIWEARIVYTTDAQYTFTINYSDLANNAAQEVVSKVVLDDTKPVVVIEYKEPVWQTIVEAVTFRFYKAETTVKIDVTDITSGLWDWDYEYKVDSGLADKYVSSVNVGGKDSFDYSETQGQFSSTATKEFQILPQFRGYVAVTAQDVSTNILDLSKLEDNNTAVIVDNIKPGLSVAYTPGENTDDVRYVDGSGIDTTGIIAADTSVYYNGPISATIKVNEANFFEGKIDQSRNNAVIHNLKIVLTTTDSNGTEVKTEYLPAGAAQLEPGALRNEFVWAQTADEYSFTINYADDLDYVLSIEYVDHSTNDAVGKTDYSADFVKSYTSNRITVDTVDPEIKPVEYTVSTLPEYDITTPNRAGINGFDYYKQDTITAVLQIEEHNFRADEVVAGYEALDVNGNPVANVVIKDTDGNVIAQSTEELQTYLADHANNWTNIGNNIWETRIVYTTDAQYTFTINYSDLAKNTADEVVSKIVLDFTAPVVTIKYEEPPVWKVVVEAVTFRFYKAEITVKVLVDDKTSGVWNLDYGFVVNSGLASDPYVSTVENKGGAGSYAAFVDAENGVWTATDKFVREAGSYIQTAEFKIPPEFRGYVEVKDTTTDIATNNTKLNALDDDKAAVIVDSIAPGVSVTYEPGLATAVRYVDKDTMLDVAAIGQNTYIYYNGPLSATIKVNEANFFEGKLGNVVDPDPTGVTQGITRPEAVIHNLKIVLTTTDSNGTEVKTEYLPANAAQLEPGALRNEFVWAQTPGTDDYSFTINYADDLDYVLSIDYVDHSENAVVGTTDYGAAFEQAYESNRITVDTVDPLIQVTYAPAEPMTNNEMAERIYYNTPQTATIVITEHNFREDDVAAAIMAKNVSGTDVSTGLVNSLINHLKTRGKWTNLGNNVWQTIIDYTDDANYTFDVRYQDLAKRSINGNTGDDAVNDNDYDEDLFTVDTTVPDNLTIAYETKVTQTILNSITFGYYNTNVDVTITADDETSGVFRYLYSYINNPGVSLINKQELDQAIANASVSYSNGGKTATAKFTVPKAVLTADNQFNGTVTFTAYDRSDNETTRSEKDVEVLVVDNIKPVANITPNDPVNKVNDVWYYDDTVTVTIVINEANFYQEDVVVLVNDQAQPPTNWSQNGDVWTGTISMSAEGDYKVKVTYTDRSGNVMDSYESSQLTVDKTEPVIRVENVKHESSNRAKDENGNPVDFGFRVTITDRNIGQEGIVPVRTDYTREGTTFKEDVTGLPTPVIGKNPNGDTILSYTVPNIEKDGIYSLKCTAKDYANRITTKIDVTDSNTATEDVLFSVNRYGSTYLIKTTPENLDGTITNQNIRVDVTEINPDDLDFDETHKTMFTLNNGTNSQDVTLIENTNYTKNQKVPEGNRWRQCIYNLYESNFVNDGEYSFTILSYDRAENKNTNTKEETGTISFTVDRTLPVIIANVGSKDIINKASHIVEFKVTDSNVTPGSLALTINGEKVMPAEGDNYLFKHVGNNEYQCTIKGLNNNIVAKIQDNAGNPEVTLEINDVTVSTNIFVRWFATGVWFWASAAGILLLAALPVAYLFIRKKRGN